MRRILVLLTLLGLVGLLGCGDSLDRTVAKRNASRFATSAPPPMRSAPSVEVADANSSSGVMLGMSGSMEGRSEDAAEVPQSGTGTADSKTPALLRKIIYTADIGLVVEDFAAVEPTVSSLVRKHNGYIAEMQLSGSPGINRSARWKIRIPIDEFEAFLTEAGALGELERQHHGSADVSEEFYDLDARIRNKKVEEQRLIKILEENTGKIEEVLKVEAELSRVRGEIERMEGRIRVLDNLTSLTTVTLEIRERVKFEPDAPVAASFPTQVSRSFQDSLNALTELGKRFVLAAVALSVWLPLLVIGGILAWLISRWTLRRLYYTLLWLWNNRSHPIGPARSSSPPSA